MINRRQILAGAAASASVAGLAYASFGGLYPDVRAASRPPAMLPVLPVIDAAPSGKLGLVATPGATQFLPGVESPTMGFGQCYLGPVVRVRRGSRVDASVRNETPAPISAHWHGLLVPGAVDGEPH